MGSGLNRFFFKKNSGYLLLTIVFQLDLRRCVLVLASICYSYYNIYTSIIIHKSLKVKLMVLELLSLLQSLNCVFLD